jgi:membrane protease YdiL (CAAX protease family)
MTVSALEGVAELLRLGEPPTVWRALLYAILLYVLAIPLSECWQWVRRRFGLVELPDVPLGGFLRRAASPSLLVHRLFRSTVSHPSATRRPWYLDDLGGHWDVYGFITMDATAEELLFRGLPLGVALWLGFSPVLPVVCGTLLWVLLHEDSVIAPMVMFGILYAWLWFSGAWSLAIAFHVVGNAVAHTYTRGLHWAENGRYPEPMPE